MSYTRAGSFQVDRDGFVVNSQSQRLQVYPPTATGFNTGALADLRLVTGESAPSATTSAEIAANLPANAAVPVNGTFDPTDPTSYNNATSMTIYDSLGAAHVDEEVVDERDAWPHGRASVCDPPRPMRAAVGLLISCVLLLVGASAPAAAAMRGVARRRRRTLGARSRASAGGAKRVPHRAANASCTDDIEWIHA